MTKEKRKKPFYKRWWFIGLVILLIIGFFGETEEETPEPQIEEVAETVEDDTEDVTENVEEEPEDELNEDAEELPEEIADLTITDVRDSATDNWKKAVTSSNVNMPDNAMAYYDEYMEEGEVHHIISFATNTTTMISDLGGLLMVDITEYEDREEHSADTIGNGMLYTSYNVYLDSGEIEQLEIE